VSTYYGQALQLINCSARAHLLTHLFSMFNLNAQLVNELPNGLALAQRGLFYGDALFETIRVFEGKIPLIAAHWVRLSNGLRAMRYSVPAHWSAGFFENEILKTAPKNARVRLTVWRSPGGLYLPENDAPQFLVTVAALESGVFEWDFNGVKIGLCESVRLPVDALSGLKTLNAARYVAAAQEAREKGWDDAVILNTGDRVCEATSSNVFWFENETLCTPPLADGCVSGITRELLLFLTNADGYVVQEKPATFARLLSADEVFLTNAIRGIQWVREIEGTVFDCAKTRKIFDLMVGYFSQKLLD
jgi:branched-chain amino acid aminotransferase